MKKKRVLVASEASYLNSGFARYYKELLSRLFKTDKYELAEFAGYGTASDPRVKNIPWKFYPNMPEEHEKDALKVYREKITNEFGEWRFDRVLLDFRPDVVLDIRDFWMNSYQRYSPLRSYYSWLLMPTIDSAPQEEDWIDTYITAEGILTYTDWSKKVLDVEGGGNIRTLGSAPPGLDYDVFKPPVDKAKHKQKFGISGDSFIVGTVMRNQKRKLFCDLMQGFAIALDKMPEEQAKKTYLYLHTSYPDKSGWDIPRLIREAGIGTRVLVSYICKLCKTASCAIFQDARTICPNCNNIACVMPNVGNGYTTEQLVDVYGLFDLFAQYSITEGFGYPQIEAAACGVPVASVDYSAMEDVVRRVGGYPINVKHMFREFESHAYRAYPDNEHLADIIVKQINLPQSYKDKLSERTRIKTMEYFDWDRAGKIWERAIDELPAPKRNWDDPPMIFVPAQIIPPNLTNAELIKWLMNNVYYEPTGTFSLMGLNLLRDVNFQASITSRGLKQITNEEVHKRLIARTETRNIAEQARCGLIKLPDDNFIRFANERNKA